ncbi:uncharacterized protein KY384_006513 [Bacidia gigantensis]|uniref:uncharacterized protein n=1 Tax=Bacidia gigantensis TaxID=2732470 RepID=UPI001D049E36|nr:uncharacterized protein KY384_006513 [Bacidia gigantensis]KAG8528824.1 hypothetical protein KY384_006513 [Bacidia gigantensis]
MDQTPNSASVPSERDRIRLHILSPNSPSVTFNDFPTSTTLAALKRIIHEASPAHPPIALQRIIYRGHPIVQIERTLKEVFSQAVINDNEVLTLHLVISAQHPHPRTVPNPIRTPPPQPSQSPQSVPQVQHGVNARPQSTPSTTPSDIGVQQPSPQMQLSPQLQQQFQQFHALQAQLAAQMANLTNHPIVQAQAPQPNTNPSSLQPQQSGQQSGLLAQNLIPQHHVNPALSGQQIPSGPYLPSHQNVNTTYREHIGPNGQRWFTRTETANVTTQFHIHQNAHPHAQTPAGGTPSIGNGHTTETASNNPATVPSMNSVQTPSRIQGAPIPLRPPENPGSSSVYLLSAPNGRPHALLVSPNGTFSAPWPSPIFPGFASHPTVTSAVPNMSGVIGASIMANPIGHQSNQVNSVPAPLPNANVQQGQNNAVQIVPLPAQADNGNAPFINQQQRREFARIVLPMAGHLWLLIRLFGFVYFFTHGASLTRTMILCSLATLVFLAQLGTFRGLWEPIRRHADNLFALGGNEQPTRQPRRVEPIPEAAQGRQGEPAPQEAAQRMFDERAQQNGNVFQQTLRRAERATALFLASLAPGVAERHIRAREAAEAARQQDIREREEREKRAAEEAREAAQSSTGEGASSVSDPTPSVPQGLSDGRGRGTVDLQVIFNIDRDDPHKCRALLNDGEWLDYPDSSSDFPSFLNWQPAGCMLHRYQAKDMEQCLQGRQISFIGDSSVRQLFWATSRKLDAAKTYEDQHRAQKHGDIFIKRKEIGLNFIWDPYLNSTTLRQQLQLEADASQANSTDQSTVVIVVGGGMWHARYLGAAFLEHYSESVGALLPFMHQTTQIGFPVDSYSLKLLVPLQIPWYESLSEDRYQTITPSRVEALSQRLDQLSFQHAISVPRAFSAMYHKFPTAYDVSGLHLVDKIGDKMVDVILNLKCNAILPQRYPFSKTCCNRYPPPNWIQVMSVGLCASFTIVVSGRIVRSRRTLAMTRFLPPHTASKSFVVLAMALCLCYFSDRSYLWDKAQKQFSIREFLALIFATTLFGAFTIRQSKPLSDLQDVGILFRDQTDEWKGWMQILILIYHYTGASSLLPIYQMVRILVASYLFMTGYGHTIFFLKRSDFSLKRLLSVIIRLNSISITLPYVMDTDYVFYYFAPLTSFWYLVLYMTMYVQKDRNASATFVASKIVVSTLIVNFIIQKSGFFEEVFRLLHSCCAVNWDLKESRFRLLLDSYIVPFGMLSGLFYIKATDSLEKVTYTWNLRFHIWLAADTRGLLRTGLFGKYGDFVLHSIIFVWLSKKVNEATSTITDWIIDPSKVRDMEVIEGDESHDAVTPGKKSEDLPFTMKLAKTVGNGAVSSVAAAKSNVGQSLKLRVAMIILLLWALNQAST